MIAQDRIRLIANLNFLRNAPLNRCIYSWIWNQLPKPYKSYPLNLQHNRDYKTSKKGQFQTNIAFKIASLEGVNPIEIARTICRHVHADGLTCFATSPGYVNFNVDYLKLQQIVLYSKSKDKCIKERIILDFGGPNIAKPMHIGHIRSMLLGEGLRRLHAYLGYEVISDIHLGDCGTQMGMIMAGFANDFPDSAFLSQGGDYPSALPFKIDYLSQLYPKWSSMCRGDEALMQVAKNYTVQMQSGEHKGLDLWRDLVKTMSLEHVSEVTSLLGCHFDLWMGESDVLPYVPDMLDEAGNLCFEDDGCRVIKISEKKNLLVQKSDGGYLYATTDLATIKWRMETYNPARIIYVADKRQREHFQDVFQVARNLTLLQDDKVRLDHVGFGMVLDSKGKVFKTRDGVALELLDIVKEAKEYVRTEGENKDAISLSTIKFAILSVRNESNILFNPYLFTQYEGKTGAYIMYTYNRIISILNKLEGVRVDEARDQVVEDGIFDLMLMLSQSWHYFSLSKNLLDLSYLCDYTYNLCNVFNQLYHRHRMLADPVKLDIKLALLQMQKVLQDAFHILGMWLPKGSM